MLGYFNLLQHLSEGGTISSAILAHYANLLCTLCLEINKPSSNYKAVSIFNNTQKPSRLERISLKISYSLTISPSLRTCRPQLTICFLISMTFTNNKPGVCVGGGGGGLQILGGENVSRLDKPFTYKFSRTKGNGSTRD